MTSPAGASRFRGKARSAAIRGGIAALLPVRVPPLRPWTHQGRKSVAPNRLSPAGPGIGVDLVSISRVRGVFEGKPALLATVFTKEELRYCTRQRRPFMHLAARFAVKEAVFKALERGLGQGMHWTDVGTEHGPSGEPRLILRGEVARLAKAKGLRRCAISLTHAGGYAMAAAIFSD